jgi:hypothetical protein
MAEARFVHLEGQEQPCLLISPDGSIPEELVVEFPPESSARGGARRVTYRLQPSSAEAAEPVYVEIFDE